MRKALTARPGAALSYGKNASHLAIEPSTQALGLAERAEACAAVVRKARRVGWSMLGEAACRSLLPAGLTSWGLIPVRPVALSPANLCCRGGGVARARHDIGNFAAVVVGASTTRPVNMAKEPSTPSRQSDVQAPPSRPHRHLPSCAPML
jgi:hypothetical protein